MIKRTFLLKGIFVLSLVVFSLPVQADLFGLGKKKEASEPSETVSSIYTDQQRPGSFADLAEALLPTVVNISSTSAPEQQAQDMPDFSPFFQDGSPFQDSPFQDFFEHFMERAIPRGEQRALPSSSLGSGFIIDAKEGYIITNNHVIQGADEVRVTLHNDETVEAEIIGSDEKTDLAVLQINPKGKTLTAVTLGDSDVIRVGDWILAIGNPFGLGGTVTAGIISARARDIQSGPYDDYLQTDASINRGNSGGPMFNLAGEVIGINTAIFSPTGGSVGIGFAIPSTLAKPIVDQLIEYGRTRRGWLGVRIQSVTDEIADSLGLDKARGALVASVTPDGPAEKAGIANGDIILEFNGTKIEEMRELPRVVAETKIDVKALVKVLSKGKEKTVTVKVGELEKAEEDGLLSRQASGVGRSGTLIEPLDMTVQTMTSLLRDEFVIDEAIEKGVIITDIAAGSEAEAKGLIVGDVILEINQTRVVSDSDVYKLVAQAKQQKRSSVLLLINRDGDVRFVALKIASDE